MKNWFWWLAIAGLILIDNKSIAGIGAIHKIKWFAPYDENGKTNFGFTKNKAGCYLIKENGKVVYVGYSGNNLYRTLYRHFQQWTARQEVVTYVDRLKRNDYKVRVILCTASQALKLEVAYINKHKPRDNKNLIDFDFKPDAGTNKLMVEVEQTENEDPF